jgi:hypothetical protein
MRVDAVDPVGELVRVALADEGGAGGAHAGDRAGVLRRVAAPAGRARGGGDAGDVEDVLDAQRDAAQRPAVRAAPVGLAGLLEHAVGLEVQVGVELAVEAVDALERRAGELDGGQLARVEPPPRLGDG